jgi:hypothetical protein
LWLTVVIVGLVMLGISLVLAALFLFDRSVFQPGAPKFTILLVSTFVQVVAIIFAIHLVLLRKRGLVWRDVGLVPASFKTLLVGLLAGVLLAGAMEAIERLAGISLGNLVTGLIAPDGFTWPAYLSVLLLIGIATPVAEELFFRGVIFNWMRTRWRPSVAITLNAALFGIIHLYYPLPYIVLVGLLGAVFAYAFERSRNIWLPIALHAGHNSAVVTAIYLSLA